MPNGRCRMHGGGKPRANGGRIERIRQARTIHGRYSADDRVAPMVAVLRRAARRAITAVR